MFKKFPSFVERCVSDIPKISKETLLSISDRASCLLGCKRLLIFIEAIFKASEVYSIEVLLLLLKLLFVVEILFKFDFRGK